MAVSITRIGGPTVTAPGTTRTPESTALPEESMDHTAASVLVRAITRQLEPTLAAHLLMDHTLHAVRRKPTTRAPELTRKHARDRMFTAVGDRRPCSVATIGSTPNGSPAVPAIRRA